MIDIDSARKLVHKKLLELEIKEEEITQHQRELTRMDDDLFEADQLLQLFQDSVNTLYSSVSNKIGDIVTEGLSIVFPDSPFKFVIEFVNRRNNVEADLYLIDEQGDRYDPIKDVGGGVGDLIALLLRITYIMLSPYENTLVCDEPCKFIDRERIEDAAEFVRKLCEEFKFQILMVTHIPEMIKSSEVVYKVEKRNRVSSLIKCS